MAAARGLAGSLFAVQLFMGDEAIGMGRVIGDGGCFFQVVDIAVDPRFQGRGYGKAIMVEIMAWLEAEVPPTGYVSLIADGPAKDLYAQFGFQPTAPASIGMAWRPPAIGAGQA
ncbi:GNAT family N-acetyltransferase [Phenylobacterium montanum]|uniref:GNAT family N-acetyltransferase n=2 Tax=Phenylobacterium montanum TaxID=2823693 RepID=A0A975G568_9CAUL|nr:GNAT family N-acetyltransferase [Caulobacter sp. S6]